MSRLEALVTQWSTINALLDEALELPPAERARWIEALSGPHAQFRDTLRELLASMPGVETQEFLGTLPRVPAGETPQGQAADEPAAGMLVGPYRLLSEIGRGGMGAVWLAEHADGRLKRRVALKLPRLAWGAALAERLARERDILATLEHPNIARLYDAGVDSRGRPYLAMERVEGRPIDAHCREHDLPLRERLALLRQACDALAHAHRRLVIHRDLKPANLLVDAEGQVRLLDFGIAKLMEGERTRETALTQHSGRALTPDYASPEQIAGAALGTASDVYSLGVVAYELLAGKRPYRLKRGSAAELEEAIAGVDPPRASDVATDPALKKALRGDLDAILAKALRKSPDERYPTTTALAEDIDRHVRGLPVLAQPESLAYRARKFVRRHRVPVAAAAVAVAALGSGLGAALWQARQARLQAQRAEAEVVASRDVSQFLQTIFSRLAAHPSFGEGASRELMIEAVRKEIAFAEPLLHDKPKNLGELYANTATLLARLSRADDAVAFRLEALEQFERAGNAPLAVVDTRLELARAYYQSDQHERAEAMLKAARAQLEGDETVSARLMRAGLWQQSARSHERAGRLPDAIAAIQAARRTLQPDLTVRPAIYADSSLDLAIYQHLAGDDAAPLALIGELRSLHPRMPGLRDGQRASLEWCHGYVLGYLGHYAEALGPLRRAQELHVGQFGRSGSNLATYLAHEARVLLKHGEPAQARAALRSALALLEGERAATGSAAMELVLTTELDLLVEQGDLTGAAAAAASLAARPNLSPYSRALVGLASALAASGRGRHDAARAEFAAAFELAQRHRAEHRRTLRQWRLVEAEIELAAGRPQRVGDLLQAWEAPAEDATDWTRWRAADLRAAAALQQGNASAALEWLASPLARLQGTQETRRSRRDELQARITHARALAASGDAAAAGVQRERAAALLQGQHADSPLHAAWRAIE
jgi:serine/threonine-protein kinase